MTKNKNLLIIAILLMVISVLSYYQSVGRSERFERGQKFLSQLNSDNIDQIEISKGENTVLLKKGDNQFLVASKHNYPAKNESINRFINDSLNITLEKNVGHDDQLAKELEVAEGGEKTIKVVFRDNANKEMVRFVIGKTSDSGQGNYVKRLDNDDQAIYLTSKGVYLSSDSDTFLKKELIDIAEEKLSRIEARDFVVEDSGDGLKLSNLPASKKESSQLSQLKGLLKGLSFDKVYLSDETTVSSLAFNKSIKVTLKDDTYYQVLLASSGEKHYLKISATFDMSKLEGMSVGVNDTEEQLKVKSDLLALRDQVNNFNKFHSPWIYEMTEYVAKKFLFSKADLIEDEVKKEG